MSSYKKLKAENEKLKREISILVNKPNEIDAIIIRQQYQMKQAIEEMYFMGECAQIETDNPLHFEGLYDKLKNCERQ